MLLRGRLTARMHGEESFKIILPLFLLQGAIVGTTITLRFVIFSKLFTYVLIMDSV